MDKIDIAFVILHYKTEQDTIECVKSIRGNIDTTKYVIVVVDNYSNNGSLEIIQNEFLGSEDIVILENSENVGFSKGLNKGITYIRDHLDADFIVTLNNDTLLLSKELFDTVAKKYIMHDFAVAGPMILSGDGTYNVNPVTQEIRSKQQADRLIKKNKAILTFCKLHVLWIYRLIVKIRRIILKPHIKSTKINLSDCLDYKLHGAFWIFSKTYFKVFETLDPATFLYGEESLLHLQVLKSGMHTLYTPDIVIYHKEDSSTDSLYQKEKEKMEFMAKCGIDSLQYYINVLHDYSKK